MSPQSTPGCLLVCLLQKYFADEGDWVGYYCVDLGNLQATLSLPSQLLGVVMKPTVEDYEGFINCEVLWPVPGLVPGSLAFLVPIGGRRQLQEVHWILNGSKFQHQTTFLWVSPRVWFYLIFKAL